ncbi:hypothetical protein C8R44DRAFT_886856 [Mycena epipterygia]|nr:hypothetical protein C8R44DRAFT_886856 [Mycena epipterygia]
MVCLQSPVGFDLDDVTIWEMARAWPQLQILTLTADSTSAHQASRMTLDGLRAFAQHCPQLGHLTITLTALVVPAFGGIGGAPRPQQTRLVWLHVGGSPISTPSQVAGFISGIFPALKNIMSANIKPDEDDEEDEDQDDDNDGERWSEVKRLLLAMQALREEERCWATAERAS